MKKGEFIPKAEIAYQEISTLWEVYNRHQKPKARLGPGGQRCEGIAREYHNSWTPNPPPSSRFMIAHRRPEIQGLLNLGPRVDPPKSPFAACAQPNAASCEGVFASCW
jgi:hypothetical protein